MSADLTWLADHMIAPVALVLADATHLNAALTRLLSDESERGRRRVRDALDLLAGEMRRTAGTTEPIDFDEELLRLRTAMRRYRLEPELNSGDALVGLIRVHRSRVATDPRSIAQPFGLSRREAEVAMLIAAGLSNKSIAAELKLSPHTVRRHTESVFRKIGVTSRAALAARLHLHA